MTHDIREEVVTNRGRFRLTIEAQMTTSDVRWFVEWYSPPHDLWTVIGEDKRLVSPDTALRNGRAWLNLWSQIYGF